VKEGLLFILAVAEIDEVPKGDLIVVSKVLNNVRVTSTVHIGVSVGWGMIECSSVSENCECSISEFRVITIVWFVVVSESEYKVPISGIIARPLEPTTYRVLLREGNISSTDDAVFFLSLTWGSWCRVIDLLDGSDLVIRSWVRSLSSKESISLI